MLLALAKFYLTSNVDVFSYDVVDTTKIFDHAQFYRIFVCNLTFGSMGELLFGLAALCPLLRRFEREVRFQCIYPEPGLLLVLM